MGRRLPRHPTPPADLSSRSLPHVGWGATLFRIHPLSRDALHFGKSRKHRFDDPEGQYGVLYAGASWLGAFIETAGHHTGRSFVTTSWLEKRAVSEIRPRRKLRLVDLRGRGLARLKADARLSSGEHGLSQEWSRALWSHPAKPDGICYASRHDPKQVSVALFERARADLKPRLIGCLGARNMDTMVAQALDHYELGLIPD